MGQRTGNPPGRPKGTYNKKGELLRQYILERFPDYDPVIQMIEMANDEEQEAALRLSAHKEVAQYIYPKLRAVDVQQSGTINITLSEADMAL